VKPTFLGYQRADGRVGTRDQLLVLPLAASLVPLAHEVAAGLPGAVSIGHEYESARDPVERARVTQTFLGTACSPNVGWCVALGDSALEPALLEALADIPHVQVLDADDMPSRKRLVEEALQRAATWLPSKRTPVPLSALVLGTECGGSDAWSGVSANPALGVACDLLVDQGATVVLAETTELIGAEHLLALRAETPEVAEQLLSIVGRYEQALDDIGQDIRGAQPTVGNMAGGLTTIEEKSLGASKKAGSRPICAVVEFAEEVPRRGGVVVMDTPGHDIEQMTGMIAGGCQVVVFTTGRGTPTGSAIAPVLKVATNTAMFKRLSADLDLDAGAILEGESLDAVGKRLAEKIVAVASGELVSAERRRAADFALSRFAPGYEQLANPLPVWRGKENDVAPNDR
jgi:altronate dehydratase large subunit